MNIKAIKKIMVKELKKRASVGVHTCTLSIGTDTVVIVNGKLT